jgi:hypothetical protein
MRHPHRNTARSLHVAATAVAMMTISACGSTYVDDELLAESAAATSTTTAPPADTATSTPASTVAGDVADAAALLTNVDQLWAEIEPTLRADHPEALFPMEQAVLLATTSVERRRPADASKGALILRDLAATLIN